MHEIEGVFFAALAALFYNAGAVLQAAEARREPARLALRPALLARLVRRPRWLVATALVSAGWPLNALALALAPLSVVQPVLALGLVLLLWAGHRRLGEQVGFVEVAAVLALVVGVTLIAASAPAQKASAARASNGETEVALAALAVLAVVPWLVGPARRALAPFAAGIGFALSAVTTKLMSERLLAGALTAGGALAVATAAASALATLAEMSAFQEQPAARVCPTVFATQAVVPVLFAVVVLHERSSAHGPEIAVLVGGLAILAVAVAVLARGRAVTAALAEAPPPGDHVTCSRESAAPSAASVAGDPS